MQGQYSHYQLSNGLQVILHPIASQVAHVALYINVGSRDEAQHEQGMAHFIEHTIFKGTKKRRAYHVLNRLESVGGDLNAWTTKEETCLYAALGKAYLDRALELFADVAYNSVFPPVEIEKEKQVVFDEMDSYKDTPSEQILDDFEGLLFKDHPLGGNILGTRKSVGKFSQAGLLTFFNRFYRPDRMVLAIAGDVDERRVIKGVEKYFGLYSSGDALATRVGFENITPPFNEVRKRKGYQAHTVLGGFAPSSIDQDRVKAAFLINYLGGPAMTSRLNLLIRERHGLTYNIEAGIQPLTDTGYYYIYFGTEAGLLEKTTNLVQIELKRICDEKMGSLVLQQAKRQQVGMLLLSSESPSNRINALGRQWLHFKNVETTDQIISSINEITQQDVLDMANRMFSPTNIYSISFHP